MQEYLVGIYQEVGKKPDIIKIKNDKAYLEKLVDGEYTTAEFEDCVIIYKKYSERLRANIYLARFSQIGLSIKGKIFMVARDENGNFKSLNKLQFKKCSEFLLKESFNYKGFDEQGRLITKKQKNKKFNQQKEKQENNQNKTSQENTKFEFVTKPISSNGMDIAQSLRLEPVKEDSTTTAQSNSNEKKEAETKVENAEKNTSNSNINANTDNKEQNSTNDTTNEKTPVIRLSDEETLQVLNKMINIIYDYLQKLMEMLSNDDE